MTAMTNKELRALLNEFPDDLPVYIESQIYGNAIALDRRCLQQDELISTKNSTRIPALFIIPREFDLKEST